MNRTDRLLAIVLELQARGNRRAQDLADTFETSKRTIYRDIQALAEAGVPIVATPGQGYGLVEGYFLPPLTFRAAEATMLLLGSEFMAQNFDADYRAAALAAGRKIEAVLPEASRQEVRALLESIHLIPPIPFDQQARPEMLTRLRLAILARRSVRLRYRARSSLHGSGVGEREVDPYALVHDEGAWYLAGYCHLRRDIRHFKLARIESLELLDRTFVRPADFEVQDRQEPRELIVRARFDDEAAPWVQEARFYYITAKEETADGLLVTLQARREDEVLPWLLSWGAHVEVLEPDSLRQRLAEEATAIQRKHAHPRR
jgi:predicted DNA-binding transcriptional regulator YafY